VSIGARYRAVVFDMDGLLLETEDLWHASESELFERHGVAFTREDQLALIGTGAEVSSRYYAERLGLPAERGPQLFEEMIGLMHERVRRQVEARPGARELVGELRRLRVPLALASNSPRYLADDALATAGLADAFEVIVTADDVEHPKPAPDIYLLACERLGVPAPQALALEDSASGVTAAKAAGLACIAVPMFAETDVSAADQVVDSLERLLAPPDRDPSV
jgi:HAD superfamily hydrolase (TIGR01509 family)